MSDDVLIERRFRGPAESANGGYACGLVASALAPGPAAEVTLRAPPPLDRHLELARTDEGAELRDGETLVATGRGAAPIEIDLPDPVSAADAAAARESSPMQHHHPYPGCFVCGSDREAGDGLLVICGPVPGRETELVAAPFETAEWMADAGGRVRPELIWSVLDCPGGIATMLDPDVGISVLGRLAAELRAPLEVGGEYVAAGWLTGKDGRKLGAGTAIFDGSGAALAVSSATWIELREQPA